MVTAVDMSNFSNVLQNLPTAALMILDTCHAGAFAEDFRYRGFYDNTEFLRELASQKGGVAVLAGSSGKELASSAMNGATAASPWRCKRPWPKARPTRTATASST